MSRNKTIAIVVAAILLFIAIVASLTEYREVSAYEWKERFNYDDEEPMGLYLFKEVVSRYFENVPVSINTEIEEDTNENELYVQFVPRDMDDDFIDRLISIARTGNDVLIIGDEFNNYFTDTVPQFFDDVYIFDSTLTFNFTDDNIFIDSNYVYKFQNQEFDKNQEVVHYLMQGLNWEDDLSYVRVATPDSMALLTSFDMGKGRIFYHLNKDLFYNYSYHQPQIFDYTQRMLAHFDPKQIHLLNPLTIYGAGNFKNNNPLEFIMSQPALKAAYYLLILGTLLYVFFGGKRKQKIIPVIEKNENTSLEYIETVSQLFYQQEQHEKLVFHMKNIFYHKMLKKFYVSPGDPNYVQVLSKKSKISATELQYIIQRFKDLDNHYTFTGDQLASLNQRLESIYNEIETH